MKALAHENIAQVYCTIEAHGCTYLVMEIIAGGELFDTVDTTTLMRAQHKHTHILSLSPSLSPMQTCTHARAHVGTGIHHTFPGASTHAYMHRPLQSALSIPQTRLRH